MEFFPKREQCRENTIHSQSVTELLSHNTVELSIGVKPPWINQLNHTDNGNTTYRETNAILELLEANETDTANKLPVASCNSWFVSSSPHADFYGDMNELGRPLIKMAHAIFSRHGVPHPEFKYPAPG
jgi:hypothetical protein